MSKSEQKQSAALEALLESTTLTEAAEKAGISRKTLYNYVRNDVQFARAYKQIIEETATAAAETVEERAVRATDIIEQIMNDQEQPATIRLKAAEMILAECDKKRTRVTSIAESNVTTTSMGLPW